MQRPFWQQYLFLIGIDTLIVLTAKLIFGGVQIASDLYFISSGIFILIAILPIFTEIGSNVRAASQLAKGQDIKEINRLQEENLRFGTRITYLFGLVGLTAFLLALIFA